MNDSRLDFFHDKQKAIYHAIWLNFLNRNSNNKFGVIHSPDDNWAVLEKATSQDMEMPFLNILPKNMSKLSYKQIRHIRMDNDPLPHLEELCGMFSTMDGELLRFIINAKIPLERLIRFELACRGFDENHRWCGFETAEKIWLK